MNRDHLLLTRYALEHSNAAFTELVQTHAGLVYGAALRRAGGDTAVAEEAMQRVFVRLARDAGRLASHPALVAWLYTTTRNATVDLLRATRKRRAREHLACLMQPTPDLPPSVSDTQDLRAVLDPAMDALTETDRTAILLRFFEQRPFAEVGRALRISEDAARMRTARALEQLRTHLRRRGIVSTAAVLGGHLLAQASGPVPAALIRETATGALARAAGAGSFLSAGTVLTTLSAAAVVALAAARWLASAADQPLHAAVVAAGPVADTAPAAPRALPSPAFAAAGEAPASPAVDTPEAAAARRFFHRNWGWRLEAAGVPRADYERLERLALAELGYAFRATPTGAGFAPSAPDAAQRATAALRAGMTDDLRAAYDREFPLAGARALVLALAAAAFQSGEPLTAAQADQVLQAVARHGLLRAAVSSDSGIPAIAAGLDRVDWAAADRALQSGLSAGQRRLLEQGRAWLAARREEELHRHRRLAQTLGARSLRDITDEPESQARALRILQAGLPLRNAGFYRAASLTPDQILALEEAIAAHAGRMLDLRATERQLGADPAQAVLEERRTTDGRRVKVQVNGSIAALKRVEEERFQAEQAAILGAAGAERFRAFERDAAPREFIAHLVATLTARGLPPTSAQVQALAAAVAAGDFTPAGPTTLSTDDFQSPRASAATWRGLLAAAAPVLSAEQTAVLQTAAARADDERTPLLPASGPVAQSRP